MRRLRFGLYSRFFFLFGSSTLLLALCIAIGAVVVSEDRAMELIQDKHAALYDTLSGGLSGPIDLEKLKQKVKGPKADVMIVRGEERVSTSDDFPEVSEIMETSTKIESLYFAKHNSRYYLLIQEQDNWVVATALVPNLIVYPGWLVNWPWLMAFAILCVSYIILRRMLRPINEATKTALMVSQGHFDYKINKHPKTELADLTKGLNKMSADLQQLFDAKNELLLAVSHELRSPLARMNVSLAMLEPSKISEGLQNDVRHMDTLVEQLLEGERLQHDHRVLHLNSYFIPMLVDEVINETGISGRVELVGTVPEQVLNIDVGRIKFLIRNLLLNAIEHSEQQAMVKLSVEQLSKQIRFCVTDSGQGIPEHALNRIFEPFYCVENTTHRNTKGTGLGLFLCQRIANAHNGTLTVKSAPNKGSTFTLLLPTIG